MKNCFVKSKVWALIFNIFSLKKMLEIPKNTNMLIFFCNSDEENDDKNDELDAEEGKADENIDEDFWAGEDETEENEDEQKEGDEDLDKTGILHGKWFVLNIIF